MSTIGGTAQTLLDLAKATNPDGSYAKIIEILKQRNEILDDMVWMQCNDGDSHQTTIRTGLPSGTYRRFNVGVAPTKGTTAQVRVGTCMLEANSIIDADLARKGGNEKAARASQAVAHIMGLSDQTAAGIWYEDERVSPDRFTGLAAHYASVSTNTAASAANVIDAAGTTGDNLSIWIVTHGENAGCMGLYPVGSVAGLKHEDKGEVEVIDATGVAGATFTALKDKFQWKHGLCVPDWTQNVRICNVDVANLRAESSDADLIKLLIRAVEMLPAAMGSRYVYVNRTAKTWLRVQSLDKGQNTVTQETVFGKPVTMVDGIPVRVCDGLLNTEDRLT